MRPALLMALFAAYCFVQADLMADAHFAKPGVPREHGYTQAQAAEMDALVERVTRKPKPVVLYRTEAERVAAIAEVYNAGRM